MTEKTHTKNKSGRHIIAVKRTDKHIYCDLIDPKTNLVIDSASDLEIEKGSKSERAIKVGELIAEVAASHKVKQVIFDRRGYKYHGRVKALAEAARAKGLEF